MTPADLLTDLAARGVVLRPKGDRLRYRAPRGALTPDLREEVLAHKPELLRLLADCPRPYLGPCGELVVPLGCAPAFAWWLAPGLKERRRRFEAARQAALDSGEVRGSA